MHAGERPNRRIGLAFVDLSTGEFRATEFRGEKAEARLRDELGILRPREILLPQPATLFPAAAPSETNGLGAVETRLDEWVFESEVRGTDARGAVSRGGARRIRLAEHPQADSRGRRARALLAARPPRSGRESRKTPRRFPRCGPPATGLEHLDRIAYYEQQDAMVLDQVTARNLELVEPSTGDDPSATLLARDR